MIEISITDIVGEAPFNVYLCDDQENGCMWISSTNDDNYTFVVPPPFNGLAEVCIKVIDGNDCEIINCVEITE